MDNMTREEYEELTTIKSNSGKQFTLATLRNLYVISKEDARQFSLHYNLSVSVIKRHIEDGAWDEARTENILDAKRKLYSRMDKQVEIQAELELKIQALEMIKVEQQVDHLLRHYARFGDLFVRNLKTEEIEYTQSGQPKCLTLPSSTQDLMKRRQMTELLQGYKKLLKIQELESPDSVNNEDVFQLETTGGKDQAQKLLNIAQNSKKE